MGDIVRWAGRELEAAGIAEAALEASILAAHALGCRRTDVYLRFGEAMDPGSLEMLKAMVGRRRKREPLQYIIGIQEFMSLEFQVDRRVLIPRADTEVLVETAIDYLKSIARAASGVMGGSRDGPSIFVDVGTGSGCIAVSIAKYCENVVGWATDMSARALEVAMANAVRHGVADRLTFSCGDLLEPLKGFGMEGKISLVVSNPPYIDPRTRESLQPEVGVYEPEEALYCSDIVGLYSRLADQAAPYLVEGGMIAVEVGDETATVVKDVFASRGSYVGASIVLDYGGRARVVRAVKRDAAGSGRR